MKSRFQTIAKLIQIQFSIGIQIFGSLFAGKFFFPVIRCNKEFVSQISSNSKVPKISSEFL
jgi:hypothetical protein